MREKSGNSKGVGFARIDDNELCDSIIQELNNKPFPGNFPFIYIYCKLISKFLICLLNHLINKRTQQSK
jgi:hypothetical protein